MAKGIVFQADTSALAECLKGLSADLVDVPQQVRMFALDFLNDFSQLVSIESDTTSGANVTLLFKPSQRLLDFCAAVRTRNFDGIVI